MNNGEWFNNDWRQRPFLLVRALDVVAMETTAFFWHTERPFTLLPATMQKKNIDPIGGTAGTQAQQPAAGPAQAAPHPADAALLEAIAERSAADPLVGAKIGGKEVTQRLLAAMQTEQGVHIESLLCALGAIAGYACQASVRAQALARGLPATALLTTVETRDGKTYFFGEHINKLLAQSPYSVWGIAASGAQKAGCTTLPDLAEIFSYNAATVGTEAFGKPRAPDPYTPPTLPLDYLLPLWPVLLPQIVKFCPNPEHWPILLALSTQEIIVMAKDAIDPCLALRIVMESAIPMSKVNLENP